MANSHVSRRNFITSVAAGAATVTALPPLQGFSNIFPVDQHLNADREINIICTEDLSGKEQQMIRSISKNINLQMISGEETTAFDNAEVVIGNIGSTALRRANKLKWVQVLHAGVENMSEEMKKHPLVLTNMQKVFAPVIAEQAIALLLSLTRGIAHFAVPNFQRKKWVHNAPENIVLDDLYEKTIGIVGMGGIGSETARRLHYGFHMRVLATDAKPMHAPDFVEELHDPGWFMEMVPKVDVLMSAAPLTKITRGMFNEQVFSSMKPDSYFINMSRGGLVNQDALVNALKNKKIRGAGLDVVTPEPLPADDPLWTCPNLVITGHNSTNADVRHKRLFALVMENVRRYSLGLPLMNVVDKDKGY